MNSPAQSETELLRGIRNGDAHAFDQLFRTEYASLLDFATAWCGSEDVAKEIISDVFLWLYVNRLSVAPRTTLAAYVMGAVRHRALNVLRSERRSSVRYQELHNQGHESVVPRRTPSPEEDYVKQEEQLERSRTLAKALAPLSQTARSVFILRVERDMSYEEIADAIGISANAAKTQFSRALSAVKRAVPSFQEP